MVKLFQLHHIVALQSFQAARKPRIIFHKHPFIKVIPFLFLILMLSAIDTHAQSSLKKIGKLATECRDGNVNSCQAITQIAVSDNDGAVCIAAVEKISDPSALSEVVFKARLLDIELAALEKIQDVTALTNIVLNHTDVSVRDAAMEKLTDKQALITLVKKSKYTYIREEAFGKIQDQEVMAEVCRQYEGFIYLDAFKLITDQKILNDLVWEYDKNLDLARQAIKNINDQNYLSTIVLKHLDNIIRLRATQNLDDQKILIEIVKTDPFYEVREIAAKKITDQSTLIYIAKNDSIASVREKVVRNLEDQPTLTYLALNDPDNRIRYWSKLKIIDQQLLQSFALDSENCDKYLREESIKKIADQDKLLAIALTSRYNDDILVAVEKLTGQPSLAKVAMKVTDTDLQFKVLKKITDINILIEIFKTRPDLAYVFYRDKFIDDFCPKDVITNVIITDWKKNRFDGHIYVQNGKICIWCNGAIHTWTNTSEYIRDAISTIQSDSADPVTFMVDRKKGYIYLSGKGTIITKNGGIINYPFPSDKGIKAVIWKGSGTWNGLNYTVNLTSNAEMNLFSNIEIIFTCIDGITSAKVKSGRDVYRLTDSNFNYYTGQDSGGSVYFSRDEKKLSGIFKSEYSAVCKDQTKFPANGNWEALPITK